MKLTLKQIRDQLPVGKLKACFMVVVLYCISLNSFAVTYYNKSSGTSALQTLSNWGTNTDGTGTAPSNFTTAGDIFNLYNGTTGTISGAWVITGVTLNVGNGGAVNLTIPAGASSLTGTGVVNVNAGATLTISNATNPTLGTLNATSTVVYGGTATHTILATTYGNLTYSSSGAGTWATGTTTIAGNYSHSAGTVTMGSTAATYTINITGNYSQSGSGALVMASNATANTTITVTGTTTINSSSVTTELSFNSAVATTGVSIFQSNGNATISAGTGVTNMIDWGNGTNTNNYFGIKGNLTISGTKLIMSTATTAAFGFVFNGTGVLQTLSNTSTGSASSTECNYRVNSGAYVRLSATLSLGTATTPRSSFTVTSGGTLDCSTFTIIDGRSSGGGVQVSSGGKLIVGSTSGINGNITAAGSTFSGGANYVFNGAASQVTGNLLPAAITSGGSVTISNGAGVTLSQATSFASGDTLNLNTGALTITPGLTMSSGSYVVRDNGTLSATPGTYSGVNLIYKNLGTNTSAVTTGQEFPATFTGSVNVDKTGATITLNNAKTITGGITITAGTLDASTSNYNISLTGNWTNNSGTSAFTARSATVTCNGSSAQTLGGSFSTTFNNLTINNASGVSLGVDQTVNSTLTLSSGRLDVNSSNLILGASAAAVSGSFSSSNMIIADGTGSVMKKYSANGSYTFPIGDASPNYSPITLNVTGSAYSSAYVALNVQNLKHPNNANTTNYLNRYWSVATSGITGLSYSVTSASYVSSDVVGTEANLVLGFYPNALPWSKITGSFVITGLNFLSATGSITAANGDITGINTINPSVSVAPASAAICSGSSQGLTATGTGDTAFTYSWIPAGGLSATTGTSITATPTVTSTYTVTATDGNGFTATNAVTLTVNAAPAAITGSSTTCVGQTILLSDATGGGIWTSTSTGVANIGSGTGIVTGVSAGTTTISYTLASGCAVATVVTVNPLPTISGGSGVAFCAGSSTTLTATGGTTYTWSPGTNLSATTGASVTANPTSTATYTITGTNSNGCANTSTVTITVNPLPTISGGSNVAICTGSSTTLTATGGSTYTWSPGTGLSATTGTSVTANPGSTTTYTVTGTSAAGCSNKAIVTVSVNTLPTISGGSNVAICSGSSTTLTATGGTTYTWSPGTNLSATTGASVTANPTTTRTYTITGTSGAGCSNTATVTVSVNSLPTVSGGSNVAICNGSSTTLTATGATTYTWAPGTGLSATTGTSVTANPSSTVTYTVTGTNGCSNTATVTVTVNALPTISGGSSVAICNGSSTTFTATGGTTYTWSPGTGLSATTGASVTASPSSTTTYTVTGTNASGCSNTATVTVTVNALPTISSGSGVTICVGGSTTLTATGGVTYTWSPGTGLSATTGASVTANPSSTKTYTVTGTNSSGCSNTGTVTVSVNPVPSLTSASNNSPFCAGQTLNLNANGASNVTGYTWTGPVAITSSTSAAATVPSTTTAASGTFTVTVVNGAGSGCTANYTTTATVNPVPSAAPSSNTPMCVGGTISLTANPAGGASVYTWSGASLSSTTAQNPSATPTVTATYSLTVTNGSGLPGCSPATVYTTTVTVNSIPTSSPTNNGPTCSGTSVTLSANPGGSANTYLWSGASLVSSTAQNPTATPTVTTTYSLTVSYGTGHPGCSPVTVYTTSVSVYPIGRWSGAVDTNWGNNSNWCGNVPLVTTDILVPSGITNYPVITSGTYPARNITIQSGASAKVNGGTLEIAGSVTNSGTFNATNGTIVMNGSSAQTIPASTFSTNTIKNLTINNSAGVTLGGTLNISEVVKATTGNLSSGGYLTLLSTSAKTALIDGSGAGNVLGAVTMQRYLDSTFGYRIISSPFDTASVRQMYPYINMADTFPQFFKYKEDTVRTGWITDTLRTNVLSPMQGYGCNFGSSYGPSTFSLRGIVNNGTINNTLYNHNYTYTLGFNCIGNPYPSPIDWHASTGWTKVNIDDAIYYYDNSDTNRYYGTYSSYVAGVSSNAHATGIIPAMQGFFVHVSSGSYPVTATLNINNNARVNNLTPYYHKTTAQTIPLVRLSARFDSKGKSDPMVVCFRDGVGRHFNSQFDALKMLNTDDETPNLYSISDDKQSMSIYSLPMNADSFCVVPLGLSIQQDGWVNFDCSDIEAIPVGMHAYLMDAKSGISQDAMVNPNYRVFLTQGTHENRFFLCFKPEGAADDLLAGEMFNAYSDDSKVYIDLHLLSGGEGDITLFDLSGRKLLHEKVQGYGVHDIPAPQTTGVYIVSFVSNGKATTKKIFINRK